MPPPTMQTQARAHNTQRTTHKNSPCNIGARALRTFGRRAGGMARRHRAPPCGLGSHGRGKEIRPPLPKQQFLSALCWTDLRSRPMAGFACGIGMCGRWVWYMGYLAAVDAAAAAATRIAHIFFSFCSAFVGCIDAAAPTPTQSQKIHHTYTNNRVVHAAAATAHRGSITHSTHETMTMGSCKLILFFFLPSVSLGLRAREFFFVGMWLCCGVWLNVLVRVPKAKARSAGARVLYQGKLDLLPRARNVFTRARYANIAQWLDLMFHA